MRRLPALLAAVPPLVVAILIAALGVDVPFMDQWELVPYLARDHAHTLTLAQLWAQHNEHRLFFPRLVMIGLARVSGWNTRWEMAFSFLVALALFAVLIWGLKLRGWLVPLASLLVFSLGQKENWFWGWQIQIFLSVAAASAALVLLARPPTLGRTLVAAALGLLAFGSFADGGLVFAIGLALLVIQRAPRGLVALFGAIGAGAFALYLHGYVHPTADPPVAASLHHPLVLIGYGLAYLGAPLGGLADPMAMIVGAIGLVLLTLGARARFGETRPLAPELLGALALAAYALGSAGMTALGRASFGLHQALNSRYETISQLLWLALLPLLAGWRSLDVRRRRALTGALIVLALVTEIQGVRFSFADAKVYRAARRALVSGDPSQSRLLYPTPDVLRQRRAVLEQLGLSVFRP